MINVGLNEDTRKGVCTILQKILANEYVLYTKTLNYHWNVQGELFGPLHALFKQQYEDLFEIIDNVAERIASLDMHVGATLKNFSESTELNESNEAFTYKAMIKNLTDDHETIIRQYRTAIDKTADLKDLGTNNFLTDIMEKHEKIAWMLRAHLAK